jgi:hypothetical protein
MCPADFPLCKSDYSICASHVAGHHKNMHCDEDYNFVMCPANFPICYHGGDCVLQACENGVVPGSSNCDHWKDGQTYISLFETDAKSKTFCKQDYTTEVYVEHKNKNLDSVKSRGTASADNLTDLRACYPDGSQLSIDEYCKKECEEDWLCGGFTVHDNHGKREIMLKRINLSDGSSVFEHKEYFRTRNGFTTYYVQAQMPEPTTRELFA